MTNNQVLLAARILLSVMFIMAGLGKFGDIAGNAAYIGSAGLPAGTLLAWLAAIFETLAGIAILIGFQTRIAALLLALFCAFTAFVFHFQPSDMMQFTMFLKNLTIAGGFLALWVNGPGTISVDARRA